MLLHSSACNSEAPACEALGASVIFLVFLKHSMKHNVDTTYLSSLSSTSFRSTLLLWRLALSISVATASAAADSLMPLFSNACSGNSATFSELVSNALAVRCAACTIRSSASLVQTCCSVVGAPAHDSVVDRKQTQQQQSVSTTAISCTSTILPRSVDLTLTTHVSFMKKCICTYQFTYVND
eukprot:5675-Heterococcus_DN1.PRE.2